MGDMADMFDLDLDDDEWNDSEPTWEEEIEALRPQYWLTATGDKMLISKMMTSHIVNTLNLIARKPSMAKAAGKKRIAVLESEARKRGEQPKMIKVVMWGEQ